MNCKFCKNKCRFTHKENEDKIDVWDCWNCPVLVSFHVSVEDNSLVKTVFLLDRNEKTYMWTDHNIKKFSYITDVGVALSKDKDPTILKFPKLMNVNPSNVHDKFKFYMLFS